MSAGESEPGPLVRAAAALEEELRRLESLAREAQRLPLTSRKNLERTTARLAELAGHEERLGARLRAVVEAVTAVGEAQRTTMEALSARAQELQRRREALSGLMDRYQELGTQARALTATGKEAAGGDPDAVRAALAGVAAQVEELAAAAARVANQADEARFEDVSRDADALRQSLLAIRNRLGLAARA